MAYEFVHRGDMWFGNVYDVYESNQWIGGVMQGKQDLRWSSVTPSGHGAEALPFATREDAATWLEAQGERIPRSRKWRYSYPAYAVLGPPPMGLLEEEDAPLGAPRLHPLLMVGIGIVGLYAVSKAFGMLGMERNPTVPLTMARVAGEMLGVDWKTSLFSVREFRKGIEVEMEHGPGGPAGEHGDVTRGDMLTTAMIALAHLQEFPDYYVRLARMEREAEAAYAPTEQVPWLQ